MEIQPCQSFSLTKDLPVHGPPREVKEIATTKEQHPHPPKVIFDRERPGQAPKEVAHNPSTLENGGLRCAGWHASHARPPGMCQGEVALGMHE